MKLKSFAILIVLSLLVAGSVFAEDINSFAEATLINFKTNDYKALYDQMSVAAKNAMPYNGMVDFFKVEKDILGELERYDKLESLEQNVGYKPMTTIRYAAYFEKTGAIITLVIVEENGKFACQNLHVDSLVFTKPEIQERLKNFAPRAK